MLIVNDNVSYTMTAELAKQILMSLSPFCDMAKAKNASRKCSFTT